MLLLLWRFSKDRATTGTRAIEARVCRARLHDHQLLSQSPLCFTLAVFRKVLKLESARGVLGFTCEILLLRSSCPSSFPLFLFFPFSIHYKSWSSSSPLLFSLRRTHNDDDDDDVNRRYFCRCVCAVDVVVFVQITN